MVGGGHVGKWVVVVGGVGGWCWWVVLVGGVNGWWWNLVVIVRGGWSPLLQMAKFDIRQGDLGPFFLGKFQRYF